MKNTEKRAIVVTIFIGAIIIGGLLIWKNKSKSPNAGNTPNQQQSQTQQSQDNAAPEEFVQKSDDGSKVNISDAFSKTRTLDGLEISNIQFKENGGITTLLADVENKTSSQVKAKMVNVDILDKEGKTITSLKGRIDNVPAGGKVQLNIAVSADVANAYDFKISNVK